MPGQKLPVQFLFNDMSSGVMDKIKYTLVPPNSVELAVNFVFDDQIGEAVTRKGITILGSQLVGANNPIAGLSFFKKSDGTGKLLSVANNGSNNVTYYYNGTSWVASTLSTDVAGLKTRFETFLDRIVRLNGNNGVVTSGDGITWSQTATLDDIHFPNGKYVKVYKAQLCVAGVTGKPDSLFISSVPNAAGTSISWTVNNREIVFNPNDGQSITGLGVVGGQMMVFKDHSMFRWNNRSTDSEAVVEVGCLSQESIVNCGGSYLAFFNEDGIWLTTGEQPTLITKRIQKWIDGIDPTFYQNVSAYGDGQYLFMSVGDVTVDDRIYANVVIRYSLNTKEFAIFSYAYEFRFFTRYIVNGLRQIVAGDSTNRVFQVDSTSNTDNGNPILFIIEGQEVDFGSRGISKEVSDQIMAYSKHANKAAVQVLVDGKKWVNIGQIEKEITNLSLADKNPIRGNFFKFRTFGSSESDRFRFFGLELPTITLLDYTN